MVTCYDSHGCILTGPDVDTYVSRAEHEIDIAVQVASNEQQIKNNRATITILECYVNAMRQIRRHANGKIRAHGAG